MDLPRFLIADDDAPLDAERRLFIVHTQPPRFIAEILGDDERLDPHWIDDVDDLPIEEVKRLMDEALAWHLGQQRRSAGLN